MRLAFAASLLAVTLAAPRGEAAPPSWLAQHGLLEGSIDAGWRVAFGNDARNPGFSAVTLGGELLVGLSVGAGFGVLVGGHGRVGSTDGGSYDELAGSLGAVLQVAERVRLLLGGDVGRAWLDMPARSSLFAGGWLASTIDVLSLGRGALQLCIRLDLVNFIDNIPALPLVSVSFGGGIGARY